VAIGALLSLYGLGEALWSSLVTNWKDQELMWRIWHSYRPDHAHSFLTSIHSLQNRDTLTTGVAMSRVWRLITGIFALEV
jgi:hypothetical protein